MKFNENIQIRCLYAANSTYFNYKEIHSIVLTILVDANYKFVMIDMGAYGKNSDGRMFSRSKFGQKTERIIYISLALKKLQVVRPFLM